MVAISRRTVDDVALSKAMLSEPMREFFRAIMTCQKYSLESPTRCSSVSFPVGFQLPDGTSYNFHHTVEVTAQPIDPLEAR